MELLQTIFMGIIQGLSEFLPVSSSGHLVFTSAMYNFFTGNAPEIETGEEIFVSMMLHIGTLFSILIFFWNDILDIIKALFNAVKTRSLENHYAKMGVYVIIATVFTILVAYPLNDISETLMYSPKIVAGLLIFTGIYLIIAEKFKKQEKDHVNLPIAILMGIAQGIAAFPGLSRSGLTIATGLLSGVKKFNCAKFSFLLSFPIILGASIIYPLLELDFDEVVDYNWLGIFVGVIVSAVVGYYCIKYFLKFLEKFSLDIFGYYCIIVGILGVIFFSVFNI
ncbi:undecaprenyl-diphosphate phosphatase [bacterium]|nr:undecaprenyl-diphosphate phosphatase [bacterium]